MLSKWNQRGFTLIEILVVITLILIIAGIALPRFAGVSAEGKKAKAAGELKTLQTALDAYLLKPGASVPADWGTLKTELQDATPRLIGNVDSFEDPFKKETNYGYAKGGTEYYVIYSVGPKDKTVTINAEGDVTPGDETIYVTNGQLPDAP